MPHKFLYTVVLACRQDTTILSKAKSAAFSFYVRQMRKILAPDCVSFEGSTGTIESCLECFGSFKGVISES